MMKSLFAIALLALSAQVSAQMMNVVYTPDFPVEEKAATQVSGAK